MARKFDQFAEMMLNKCTMLRTKGKHTESLSCMTDLTKKMPELSLAWYHHGLSLYYTGKLKEAVGSFSKAVKLDPTDWASLSARAFTKFLFGDFKGAKSDINKTLEINQRDVHSLVLGAILGIIKGDAVVTEAYLKKAFKVDDDGSLDLYLFFLDLLLKHKKISLKDKGKIKESANKLGVILKRLRSAKKKLRESKK